MSANHILRRAIQERMKNMGLAPDLKNDERVMNEICQETGASREDASREFASMRLEQGSRLLRSFGIVTPPQAFLASLSTTRHMLRLDERAVRQVRFQDVYDERSKEDLRDLVADLQVAPGRASASQPGRHNRQHHYERDLGNIYGNP